jgi:hypothetical protein
MCSEASALILSRGSLRQNILMMPLSVESMPFLVRPLRWAIHTDCFFSVMV